MARRVDRQVAAGRRAVRGVADPVQDDEERAAEHDHEAQNEEESGLKEGGGGYKA